MELELERSRDFASLARLELVGSQLGSARLVTILFVPARRLVVARLVLSSARLGLVQLLFVARFGS